MGELRKSFEAVFDAKEAALAKSEMDAKLINEALDITMEGFPMEAGSQHPIMSVYYEIADIFTSMGGFEVAVGPEVELEHYNFDMLNIPAEHPARDMQDTFYISDNVLLRTHTSPPVQSRYWSPQRPPL